MYASGHAATPAYPFMYASGHAATSAYPSAYARGHAATSAYPLAYAGGHVGENLVYSPRRKDSRPLIEGLPAIIVVYYSYVKFYQDDTSFNILEKVEYRKNCRGKKIFEDMLLKLDNPDTSISEKEYILSLKESLSEYDVRRQACDVDLYIYLEIAVRFNMKLRVCRDVDYYYELTE